MNNIEYKFLTIDDIDQVTTFLKNTNVSSGALSWILKGVKSGNKQFAMVGEIVDGIIVGAMSTCTFSFWFNAENEIYPAWLGIRLDRLSISKTSFTQFMKTTTRMLTRHYEQQGIFQFYIIRRLPVRTMTDIALSELTSSSWETTPYTTTVEAILRSQEDYDNTHYLFKTMIGAYKSPVVVLFSNLDNNTRTLRLTEYQNE
jgi:hypothetical protein